MARARSLQTFCVWEGFRGGSLLDVTGTLQLNSSLMYWKGIRYCLEVSWLVVSGSGSCWGGCEDSLFHVGSVVVLMVMVTFLVERTFPPLVQIRENPEFHDLMRMDKGRWLRLLLAS